MILLAPQYCASIYYYAALAGSDRAIVDVGLRFDKRFKSVHRCQIIDTRGPLQLTVPISKQSPRRWDQVAVSAHGQWWSDHIVSLESAYGRTPFFEFYIDRLRPWIANHEGMAITRLDQELDTVLRSILHIDTPVDYLDLTAQTLPPSTSTICDCRRELPPMADVPYYQVRQRKFGFVPSLSILDLIFNMGPEAQLVLRDMAVGSNLKP